ncbi:hypothetical protein WJX72_007934 [[Myrmecia] bisecta]|uniref:Uncharacterized protein n=1 Tax=[Myrmecia] bisecta TaxID=41462 RepID=A0AAW1R8U2_9CHLO
MDEFDPSDKALLHLFSHILEKGFQLGAVVGTAVVVPITTYRQHKHAGSLTTQSLAPRAMHALARSSVAGVVFAGLLGAARVWGSGLDESAIQDRAYRLHYNEVHGTFALS